MYCRLSRDGVLQFLYYRDRVCVPNDDELKKFILEEAHSGSFAMHPGSTKIYQDLKTSYALRGSLRKEVYNPIVLDRVK